MIRVRLQSGHGGTRRLAGWAAATAVVAIAGLGILRLVDGYYPLVRTWRGLVRMPTSSVAAVPVAETAPPPAPDLAPPPAAEPEIPAPPSDDPYGTPACTQAAALALRLPAGVQLTSLASSADGVYALEGLVPADGVADLLTALEGLPSKARLSYWRGGILQAESYYKFLFDGTLPDEPHTPLKAVAGSDLVAWTDEVARRALRSGLRDLRLDEPLDVALGPDRLHRRYKCWARGAAGQISDFLEELGRLEGSVAVGELLVVPSGYSGATELPAAKLYAVLDLVVEGPIAALASTDEP